MRTHRANRKPKKPYTVMVVDDDVVSLNTAVSILSGIYRIHPFTSGEKALAYLENNAVDLVLLDYSIPGLSGPDVLVRLQGHPSMRHAQVIMLTGSDDANAEAETLSLGAVDFIRKPINSKVLITRVGHHLELLEHRRHLEALVDERTVRLSLLNEKLHMRETITLRMLARAADMRDHDTGDHLERTTEFVRIIVDDIVRSPRDAYRLTKEEGDIIVRSAMLHDIGKIAIPDSVLLKPGRLTDEEFLVVKKHPSVGAEMFDEFIGQMHGDPFLNVARDIAYTHHEHWNGAGYPRGVGGADIPLSGRIAAVADVYDALTSSRPYKTPIPHAASVDIIRSGAGTQFDPYLTDVFLRHADDFNGISFGSAPRVVEAACLA